MNAIHIIMATTTSANPHDAPNTRIESIDYVEFNLLFLVFGILLIVAGSLLASFEKQRFSVSFIVFGGIGVIFAFMYWISAEKILIALRKLNAERTRQARLYAQYSGTINFANMNGGDFGRSSSSFRVDLPSYEQSIFHPIDIPPPYEEAIKIQSTNNTTNDSSQSSSITPIHSISLAVDQATATNTSGELPNRKRPAPILPPQSS